MKPRPSPLLELPDGVVVVSPDPPDGVMVVPSDLFGELAKEAVLVPRL